MRFSWYELGPGDFISVLNGPGTTSPQLARLTGSHPAGGEPTVLHGQGSSLLVVFHSDGSGQHQGFLAETEAGQSLGRPGIEGESWQRRRQVSP